MSEKLPTILSKNIPDMNRRRIIVAELREELVGRANSFYHAVLNSRYLPQTPSAPLLSGDDEHLWIGLAP